MMGANTSLHADQAGWRIGEPVFQLAARQLALEDNGPAAIIRGRMAAAFSIWAAGRSARGSTDPFNRKNYTLDAPNGLEVRHDIVKQFIDGLNDLLQGLAQKYPRKVFCINLRNTLSSRDDWANELHPGNKGFAALADKIDAALQANISEPGA